MKILHVLDHSAPLHSGYTFRTLALVNEQRKRGWQPVLMTGPKQNSGELLEQSAQGWDFYRTPSPSGRLAQWPVAGELLIVRAIEKRLRELVATVQPDLIHAHSPVLNGLAALRVANSAGLPLVYEVRAFWEDAAVEHGTHTERGPRYRATRALETYVLKRADAVTTICEGLRRDIVARGVASQRVTVIPNAVDVERFTYAPAYDAALAQALGVQGCYVLGFAGSFYGYEGLEIAIRAMAEECVAQRDIKLLLVGGGPEDDRLKSLAAELGVGARVVFTGRVPHDEIDRYYGLMDLLVFPRVRHRLTELVTPLKPLEAMAQGKLVAASDVGGHRELIDDGRTGFLFAPESAAALAAQIAQLVDMPVRGLEAVRQAGRRFVESERTWQGSAARYATVYNALTRTTAARRPG
ncbi:TIGR04063 family PEP-CTERM/XrtA system glycosyltransferase [Salinisphaera sp. T31B1]|uniref:TIGR04063 family PEP-CTERM/XrtA system glycosyltransferase n=1 Tax=Salinisphaera sp. T31B1 TaxID=727963 RepID=UPI00334190B2